MRPVRAAGHQAGLSARLDRQANDARDPAFGCERAALSAFYAAKIAATRHSASPRDREALVRAIYEEQRFAFLALTRRRQMSANAGRDKMVAERHSERVAQKQARAPAPSIGGL